MGKNTACRRKKEEASVIESRGRRRVWGEAEGVVGAKMEVLLAIVGLYPIKEDLPLHLPGRILLVVAGMDLCRWAPHTCPVPTPAVPRQGQQKVEPLRSS